MSVVRGPLDEMIAVHTVDGFVVVESSPSLVTLERKNPWLSVVVALSSAPSAAG